MLTSANGENNGDDEDDGERGEVLERGVVWDHGGFQCVHEGTVDDFGRLSASIPLVSIR